MPKIDLITLGGIPNSAIIGERTQAVGANDCGAFALVAAVGPFGVFPVNRNIAYANNGPNNVNNNSNLLPTDTFSQLVQKIYTITGILSIPQLPGAVFPELNAPNEYNSLAAMSRVIVSLGLNVVVHTSATGYGNLTSLYPCERCRTEQVISYSRIKIWPDGNRNTRPPGKGKTHIICVSPLGGGLHWIARGEASDVYYDPANGALNNPINTINAHYNWAGLRITVSR